MKNIIPVIVIICSFTLLIGNVIEVNTQENFLPLKEFAKSNFSPKTRNPFAGENFTFPQEEEAQISQDSIDPIKEFINSMTLEEKIGQLFICAFRKDSVGVGFTKLNENSISAITEHHIGGIVFFSENISSSEQIKSYVESAKELSRIPLFICVDEEGGRVRRTQNLDVPYIESQAQAALKGGERVYGNAVTIGNYLAELGFNLDFAPVGDIYSNPLNTVIGDRAYGTNPQIVSDMLEKAIAGFEYAGIISVVKHFPGHGDTAEDSHYGIAKTDKTLEELKSTELKPFISAAEFGAPAIMAGHISCPNVNGNNEPAVFSEILLNDILREEIGFKGLIITDAMDMGAISDFYESGEAAVKALQAGADIILMPADFAESYKAVSAAIKSGEISTEELDEKLYRIIYTKNKYLGLDLSVFENKEQK